MQEVDFTETDLTGALFDNCNLTRSIFENTILEKADFRIKKAKFSMPGIVGLLDKYDIDIE